MYITFVWCCLIVLFVFIELASAVSLTSIWFAIGGVVSAFVSLFCLSFDVQVIVFLLSSLFSLFALRKYFLKLVNRSNRVIHAQIGKKIKIFESSGEEGRTLLNGVYWNVTSSVGEDLVVGSKYEVVGVDGTKLVVGRSL